MCSSAHFSGLKLPFKLLVSSLQLWLMLFVRGPHSISILVSALVGLSLSYGLALNGCLYGVVYLVCQLENKMVSVERINQYCGITREAPPVIEDNRPAESWPTQGSIQFQRIQVCSSDFGVLQCRNDPVLFQL